MQIWQLFFILKQPVDILVTVFYNLTKLTNYLFIFNIELALLVFGMVPHQATSKVHGNGNKYTIKKYNG